MLPPTGPRHRRRDVPELGIAVRVLTPLDRLAVPPEAVPGLAEQVPDHPVADRKPLPPQLALQPPQALARPPQRGLRIAPRGRVHQRVEGGEQLRLRVRPPLAAGPRLADALRTRTRIQVGQPGVDGRTGKAAEPGHEGDAAVPEGPRLTGGPEAELPLVKRRRQRRVPLPNPVGAVDCPHGRREYRQPELEELFRNGS